MDAKAQYLKETGYTKQYNQDYRLNHQHNSTDCLFSETT